MSERDTYAAKGQSSLLFPSGPLSPAGDLAIVPVHYAFGFCKGLGCRELYRLANT